MVQELGRFADDVDSTQINRITEDMQKSEPALHQTVRRELTDALSSERGNGTSVYET